MSEMDRGASPLRQAPTERASAKAQELGPMPIWNLADLYPSPKSKALQADLKKAADEALAIPHSSGIAALVASDLPSAKPTVRRAVRALEERQRPDGSFGATAQQERALIGVRALLWVEMT